MSIVNHSQLVSVYCVVLAYAVTAIHATLVLCELLLLLLDKFKKSAHGTQELRLGTLLTRGGKTIVL